MKLLLSCLILGLAASGPVRAASSSASFSYVVPEETVAAVTAADDERVAASAAKDRARLEAVFSDALHYAHSNGALDTKSSYVDSIVSGKSVYEKYEYVKRDFMPVAPGVMAMTGRALIHSRSGGQPNLIDLNFLAIWRLEDGVWRFLAWQSCRNPPAAPPAG